MNVLNKLSNFHNELVAAQRASIAIAVVAPARLGSSRRLATTPGIPGSSELGVLLGIPDAHARRIQVARASQSSSTYGSWRTPRPTVINPALSNDSSYRAAIEVATVSKKKSSVVPVSKRGIATLKRLGVSAKGETSVTGTSSISVEGYVEKGYTSPLSHYHSSSAPSFAPAQSAAMSSRQLPPHQSGHASTAVSAESQLSSTSHQPEDTIVVPAERTNEQRAAQMNKLVALYKAISSHNISTEQSVYMISSQRWLQETDVWDWGVPAIGGGHRFRLAPDLLGDVVRVTAELQTLLLKAVALIQDRSRCFQIDPNDTCVPVLRGADSLAQIQGAWEIITQRLRLGHENFIKYEAQAKNLVPIPTSPISTAPELHEELKDEARPDSRLRLIVGRFPHHIGPFSAQTRSRLLGGAPWDEFIVPDSPLLRAFPARGVEADPEVVLYTGKAQREIHHPSRLDYASISQRLASQVQMRSLSPVRSVPSEVPRSIHEEPREGLEGEYQELVVDEPSPQDSVYQPDPQNISVSFYDTATEYKTNDATFFVPPLPELNPPPGIRVPAVPPGPNILYQVGTQKPAVWFAKGKEKSSGSDSNPTRGPQISSFAPQARSSFPFGGRGRPPVASTSGVNFQRSLNRGHHLPTHLRQDIAPSGSLAAGGNSGNGPPSSHSSSHSNRSQRPPPPPINPNPQGPPASPGGNGGGPPHGGGGGGGGPPPGGGGGGGGLPHGGGGGGGGPPPGGGGPPPGGGGGGGGPPPGGGGGFPPYDPFGFPPGAPANQPVNNAPLAPYGTMIPTIKAEVKPEQLPEWDGNPDTAIDYFWKVQQFALLGGYMPEAVGYWLWSRLKPDSSVQIWYMTLETDRQMLMRSHYVHFLRGIKEGFLGPTWQRKMVRNRIDRRAHRVELEEQVPGVDETQVEPEPHPESNDEAIVKEAYQGFKAASSSVQFENSEDDMVSKTVGKPKRPGRFSPSIEEVEDEDDIRDRERPKSTLNVMEYIGTDPETDEFAQDNIYESIREANRSERRRREAAPCTDYEEEIPKHFPKPPRADETPAYEVNRTKDWRLAQAVSAAGSAKFRKSKIHHRNRAKRKRQKARWGEEKRNIRAAKDYRIGPDQRDIGSDLRPTGLL
ncbi:hypothetical protein B0H11DRAFT_1904040 [Mycena galericulata]|nr:hypothetical protein B0H11DRAFT_1904040 [Mycena galericulata]